MATTETIAVRLERPLAAFVDEVAKAEHRSRANVLRHLIAEAAAAKQKQQKEAA